MITQDREAKQNIYKILGTFEAMTYNNIINDEITKNNKNKRHHKKILKMINIVRREKITLKTDRLMMYVNYLNNIITDYQHIRLKNISFKFI